MKSWSSSVSNPSAPGAGREQQRTDRDSVFRQPGERDLRPGLKSLHQKRRQRLGHGCPQRLTQQRKAAAEQNDFRVQQMHRVRQAKGKVRRGFVENALRRDILAGQRDSQVTRLGPRLPASQFRQPAVRLRRDRLADFTVHRPARAPRLDRCPAPVQAHVTDLDLARRGAVIDMPTHDQSAADAAAQRDVHRGIAVPPRAAARLAERGDVRVIVHRHWHAAEFSQPIPQREIRPAGHVVRAANSPAPPIDRPAVADADGRSRAFRQFLPERRSDVPPDTRGARGRIDGEAETFLDRAGLIAAHQLEFRSADLDAEQSRLHGRVLAPGRRLVTRTAIARQP